MAELGDHAGALAEYRDVLAARLRVLGPDHPDTLTTRWQVAVEMAEQEGLRQVPRRIPRRPRRGTADGGP
jgi:Tetratricopeptide repeat